MDRPSASTGRGNADPNAKPYRRSCQNGDAPYPSIHDDATCAHRHGDNNTESLYAANTNIYVHTFADIHLILDPSTDAKRYADSATHRDSHRDARAYRTTDNPRALAIAEVAPWKTPSCLSSKT